MRVRSATPCSNYTVIFLLFHVEIEMVPENEIMEDSHESERIKTIYKCLELVKKGSVVPGNKTMLQSFTMITCKNELYKSVFY